MVSFEEQTTFHSHKYELPDGSKKEIKLYTMEQVKKCCLDKQRVKDVINIELSKARLLIKEHERNSALIEYFKGQIDMCIILLKRLED